MSFLHKPIDMERINSSLVTYSHVLWYVSIISSVCDQLLPVLVTEWPMLRQFFQYKNVLNTSQNAVIDEYSFTNAVSAQQQVTPKNLTRRMYSLDKVLPHNISIKHIDGLAQERRNSIANTLELRFSCSNPSISCYFILWISAQDNSIWQDISMS